MGLRCSGVTPANTMAQPMAVAWLSSCLLRVRMARPGTKTYFTSSREGWARRGNLQPACFSITTGIFTEPPSTAGTTAPARSMGALGVGRCSRSPDNGHPKETRPRGESTLFFCQLSGGSVFRASAYDGPELKYFLSGLDEKTYRELLRRAIVGTHDPENVILMEIHPQEQKTLPDFLLTEKMLGVRTVDIEAIKKHGSQLYYERKGGRVPIRRIYNRAIVDELQRKQVKLGFDWRDDLDVEWAGHPNWYFRISKFSIPYLRHESVPKTWFLDKLERVPEDLQNYALKPLYSFAGLGVGIAPKKEEIEAIPAEKRAEYILQERLHFEPVIETPFGGTKAEVRVMYVWQEELKAVLTIIRMGRGLMMGVDQNKNMEWVGASAGLWVEE